MLLLAPFGRSAATKILHIRYQRPMIYQRADAQRRLGDILANCLKVNATVRFKCQFFNIYFVCVRSGISNLSTSTSLNAFLLHVVTPVMPCQLSGQSTGLVNQGSRVQIPHEAVSPIFFFGKTKVGSIFFNFLKFQKLLPFYLMIENFHRRVRFCMMNYKIVTLLLTLGFEH